jgi:hypothetical protein
MLRIYSSASIAASPMLAALNLERLKRFHYVLAYVFPLSSVVFYILQRNFKNPSVNTGKIDRGITDL